ncbi:MAG: DUF87 domain-containing protein [Candidatus Aenigmatarchaeota archaeon]
MLLETEEEMIIRDINKLSPILGLESVRKIRSAYLLGDELARKRIRETIDAIKAGLVSRNDFFGVPIMEPPPESVALEGTINIGEILYGKEAIYPFMLKKSDLLTHIGIFGSSGSGKTNLARMLVKQLNSSGVPVLIFDFSKRNYRSLLNDPQLKEKIEIYTLGRNVSPFRFNPLKPPAGVTVSQWVKEFAEVFDHAYWLLGGGKHIILKALDNLYQLIPSPKIKDLKEYMEGQFETLKSPREKNWFATAQRPLESLTFREVGEMFDVDQGITPDKFFENDKITILEMDSLSTGDKTFLIEIILQWLRDWLIVSNKREELMGVIIIEEAHNILNREKNLRSGMESVIDLIFREVRELGLGLIYLDQHPSLISYPALGNTSIHIYMNLGLDTKSSSDIMDAAHMLGLKVEEEIDFLRKLPTGHGFIITRRREFKNTFLIRFPLFNFNGEFITDETIKKSMFDKILSILKEEKDLNLIKVPENTEEAIEMIKRKEEISSKIKLLDRSLWNVVRFIGSGRAISSSDIQKKIGISGSNFRKRAEELIDLGLIGRKQVKLSRQYAYYYFLTDEGELVYSQKYGEVVNMDDEKSLDELRQMVFADYSSRGWKIIENKDWVIFGKDETKDKVIFVTSHLVYNIGIYLEDDVDNIVFACSSKIVKNRVLQFLSKYSYLKGLNFAVFVVEPEDFKKGISSCLVEFIEY